MFNFKARSDQIANQYQSAATSNIAGTPNFRLLAGSWYVLVKF